MKSPSLSSQMFCLSLCRIKRQGKNLNDSTKLQIISETTNFFYRFFMN